MGSLDFRLMVLEDLVFVGDRSVGVPRGGILNYCTDRFVTLRLFYFAICRDAAELPY